MKPDTEAPIGKPRTPAGPGSFEPRMKEPKPVPEQDRKDLDDEASLIDQDAADEARDDAEDIKSNPLYQT